MYSYAAKCNMTTDLQWFSAEGRRSFEKTTIPTIDNTSTLPHRSHNRSTHLITAVLLLAILGERSRSPFGDLPEPNNEL